MSTLPGTHVLLQPVQHEVTLIESEAEITYIGRTYDVYFVDGQFERYVAPDSYEKESFAAIGCYLIEALDAGGKRLGTWRILPGSEFSKLYGEYSDPTLEYGVLYADARYISDICETIGAARAGVRNLNLSKNAPLAVVGSRPADSNDEWTVIK